MILRWKAPGPYEVLFTTRRGGVSEGPFESLNLGKAVGAVAAYAFDSVFIHPDLVVREDAVEIESQRMDRLGRWQCLSQSRAPVRLARTSRA